VAKPLFKAVGCLDNIHCGPVGNNRTGLAKCQRDEVGNVVRRVVEVFSAAKLLSAIPIIRVYPHRKTQKCKYARPRPRLPVYISKNYIARRLPTQLSSRIYSVFWFGKGDALGNASSIAL